ncbi:MAG: 4Fe-4S dicluster domain-containing protein [Proteobacteria bacterium]|nr:4Fe-4S dicluster domain-containing protein [Pseudomonadota bacterium]MBU4469994.1 4Fe-4S dicluster domain-containing protein [Pseudomonadota bacterium]MCG2753757.1 4Fe-4S dicluster domain-containing protein [Desulfobacteraceae bacterium]
MDREDVYEKLRTIIGRGANQIQTGRASILPKHPATTKLLTNLFAENEANLLINCFELCGEALTLDVLSEKSGMPQSEIRLTFDDMNDKGKIMKIGRDRYMLLPYVPATSERYFVHRKDDPEKMKNVALAQAELYALGLIDELSAGGYSPFRVIPSIEPVKRIIALNEMVSVEKQVLPYEQLEAHISRVDPQVFAVVPCPCRTAAELVGNPCQRATDNYCAVAGKQAGHIIKEGVGREVTRDELMDLMKRAEQDGLVHQTSNIQDKTTFICNCCPCCCPYMISRKKLRDAGASAKSNFTPTVNRDLCTLCETCVDICPMEAAYHHFPHESDESDDYIRIRMDLCIGCGDCASVCPTQAIALEKTGHVNPLPTYDAMITEIKNKVSH